MADPVQTIQTSVTIAGRCPASLTATVLQITHEMVTNAVKHGLHMRLTGQIEVALEIARPASGLGGLTLAVRDNGWGPDKPGFGEGLDVLELMAEGHGGGVELVRDLGWTVSRLHIPGAVMTLLKQRGLKRTVLWWMVGGALTVTAGEAEHVRRQDGPAAPASASGRRCCYRAQLAPPLRTAAGRTRYDGAMDGLRITSRIHLAESELEERFIAAAGPGGQNVNKVATAGAATVRRRALPGAEPGGAVAAGGAGRGGA